MGRAIDMRFPRFPPMRLLWLANRCLSSLDFRQWGKRREARRRFDEDIRKHMSFFETGPDATAPAKTVLFASFLPLPYVIKIEGLMARALAARGWRAICLYSEYSKVAGEYHRRLFGHGLVSLQSRIPWNAYRTLKKEAARVAALSVDEIKRYRYGECLAGMHSLATISSYDTAGALELTRKQRRLLKKVLLQSLLYMEAARGIISEFNPNLVIALEKGFVGCCEIFYAALEKNVDYVQWLGCHEPEALMLKRYNCENIRAHPFSISKNTWEQACSLPWKEDMADVVMRQFRDGYIKSNWFKYKGLCDDTSALNREELIAKYGLEPTKGVAVIFSPILNDANLFYGEDLFHNGFAEWLVETVRAAGENDRVNWILKLHPANMFRRDFCGIHGEYGEISAIRKAFGEVPSFLKIMPPEDKINPYALFQLLDWGLTVRGTVGAEIPCFGKPVLTAGTGRYSNFGFTIDSQSAAEYLERVRNIDAIGEIGEESTRLAMRHAFLFFKRRPAKYSALARDAYPEKRPSPFFRDVVFQAESHRALLTHPQLSSIADWLSDSRDEDFVSTDLV